MADQNRASQCRKLITSMSEESKKAKVRLITAKDRHSTLSQEIAVIEAKLLALTTELNSKKTVVEIAQKEIDETSQRIKYDEEKKTGLCIRTLDKKALSHVLSFLGKEEPAAYLACKYWKAVIDETTATKKK